MTEPLDVRGDASAVEMWSPRPLPWETKTEYEVRATATVKKSIKELADDAESVLMCRFTSSETRAGFDIENVLAYNVGLSAFTGAAPRRGMIFERVRASPPPSPSGRPFEHHHWYGLVPHPTRPIVGSKVCFTVQPFNHVDRVWWALANSSPVGAPAISGRFALYVEYGLSGTSALTYTLKQLVDGIVAGFQFDPNPNQEAVDRLAARMGQNAHSVSSCLQSPANALLGERRGLIRKRGNSVQWNPGDDKCDLVTVIATGKPGVCTVVAYPR